MHDVYTKRFFKSLVDLLAVLTAEVAALSKLTLGSLSPSEADEARSRIRTIQQRLVEVQSAFPSVQ